MKAPVVLFVYKRKDKVEQCLSALNCNKSVDETDLLIFSDGNKDENDKEEVENVRKYLDEYCAWSKFKKVYIFKSEENKGLANSIIGGVTYAMEKYGKVIVVEDDLVTSSDFLEYMNGGLDFYENDLRYGSVSAYTYPMKILKKYKEDIYVTRKGECWGWGTWKNRWDNVDWNVQNYDSIISDEEFRKGFSAIQYGIDKMLIDWKKGKIDSWAVRWCLHLYLNNQWTVYPTVSRTENIGFDGSGANCGNDYIYSTSQIGLDRRCTFKYLNVNKKIEKKAATFERRNIWKRLIGKIWTKMKK